MSLSLAFSSHGIMELHDKDIPYDDAWAHRVIAALRRHYNGSGFSTQVPEYAPWMLTALRVAASAYTPESERNDVIGELRYKLGIASMQNQWRAMYDQTLSERGFAELLSAQLFLQALPLTIDRGGVRFSVKDYISLQEKFGDDGILAGKLRVVGIDPEHVHQERGMFVLPNAQGGRLLSFLEGTDALEFMQPVDIDKRRDWVAKDAAQLQRYYDVMPLALSRLRQTIDHDYARLFQYAPDVLSQLLSIEATPVEDGFADPSPSAAMRTPLIHDMVFASLKTYREKNPLFYTMYYTPTPSEVERVANGDMRKITDFFKAVVRAHMGANQLQFLEHVQVVGKQKSTEVLSIDVEQVHPLIDRCCVANETEFFKLLGVHADPYAGLKDTYNGCAARIVISDANAIARIRELGAQVTRVPVTQIADTLRRERAVSSPVPEAGSANVIGFGEWGRRVKERKEEKVRPKGEEPPPAPAR